MSSMFADEKVWDAFVQNQLPTRKDERWKYMDLSALANKKFTYPQTIDPELYIDSIKQHRLQQNLSILLVFINGQFQSALSDLHLLPNEAVATRLDLAFQMHTDLVKQHLPKPVNAKLYPFANLNASLCTEGLFLYVPDYCEINRPIHILSIVVGDESLAAHPRSILVLGEHSKATILEEHFGMTNQSYLMNTVTNISVGKEAHLDYFKLQNEGKAAVHMANTFIEQKRNSHAAFMNISLGAELARDDLVVKLLEPGANCHTAGFYHLRANNQYVDNHIDINHIAPRSNSEMLYKGILENKSRAIFNGRLHIEKNAQKILAYQANHNLLLSNDAEVYSKPELEIYADDVKCKHGASTGQIDQDAIFYLRSRGIEQTEAVNMLLQGFADEVLQRITDEGIKLRVKELL